MYQTTTQEKSKSLTYEQIRDIVLERREEVKEPTRRKPKIVSQEPNKKIHNFQFV
jgi:hypothetical protein